jgi:signal transduction histidine kinase
VAVLLCALTAALPFLEAGVLRQGLIGFGLSASAAAAAVAAWNLHKADAQEPQSTPAYRLLEGVSVVLRDALSALRGFSEFLVPGPGKPRDGPEVREACRFILEVSDDLTAFAANLQDYIRCEQGRMHLAEKRADAAELVEAALGPCRRMAERADIVIVATLPEGIDVSCDPVRIRSAVANIVLWMARAAPSGSVVAVSLLRLPGEALAVAVASAAPFSSTAAEALSEPRLDLHGLAGLALPIARRLALLHSGDVTLEGGADGRTIARLTLPPNRVTWREGAANRAIRAE